MRAPTLITLCLVLAASPALARPGGTPFDEQTLDRIEGLNEAISGHYEQLLETASDVEARREIVKTKLERVQAELARIEEERAEFPSHDGTSGSPGVRVLEEHRIEAKSRYLEALAEKHAIDLDATSSFERHASGILVNLERLAQALEN